eukprot:2044268-Pyramimonas_sp.AAC.1
MNTHTHTHARAHAQVFGVAAPRASTGRKGYAPCRRPPLYRNEIHQSRVGASRRCFGASGNIMRGRIGIISAY